MPEKLIITLFYPRNVLGKTDSEKQAAYQRNKSLCFCLFLCFLACFLFLFFNSIPQDVTYLTMKIIVFLITFLLITCRSYYWMFSLCYAIVATAYPFLCLNCPRGLLFSIYSAYIVPTYIFLICKNQSYSLLSLIWQTIFLSCQVESKMKEIIMNPQASYLIGSLGGTSLFFACALLILIKNSDSSLKTNLIAASEANKIEYAYTQQNNFLLSLSHELRNPLNSLVGHIQLALFEDLRHDIKQYLENAQCSGELLLHLINNILDSGKAEIDALEVTPASSDIYGLCERLWGTAKRLIGQKGLSGSLSIKKNVPRFLEIDSYRITQILLNLVENSVKFTEKGRITLNIEWIPHKRNIDESCFTPIPYDEEEEGVFEKCENCIGFLSSTDTQLLDFKNENFRKNHILPQPEANQKGILKLIVGDTGCGISQEDKEKIFGKFVQVNNEVTKRQVGTGLGLYVTNRLCKKLNGQINVYSKPGKGSYFIICLPTMTSQIQVQLDLPIPRQVYTSRNQPIENYSVMVVDDSNFNIQVLLTYFNKAGVKSIHPACNGLEAVDLFKQKLKQKEPIHIITMDYDMPIKNGKDAVKEIRQYEKLMKLKPCLIIMVSGHCSEGIIAECLDPNGDVKADYFLKKPVIYDQLVDLLRIVET